MSEARKRRSGGQVRNVSPETSRTTRTRTRRGRKREEVRALSKARGKKLVARSAGYVICQGTSHGPRLVRLRSRSEREQRACLGRPLVAATSCRSPLAKTPRRRMLPSIRPITPFITHVVYSRAYIPVLVFPVITADQPCPIWPILQACIDLPPAGLPPPVCTSSKRPRMFHRSVSAMLEMWRHRRDDLQRFRIACAVGWP